jgi:hypothetical protein
VLSKSKLLLSQDVIIIQVFVYSSKYDFFKNFRERR